MSTVSPQASRSVAERVRALGAEMVDAPVSGSLPVAEAGALTIMVGGSEETFAKVEPILRHLGATVLAVGDNGSALLMKLAVNISLAEQMLAFSEGVLLAERGGIDRELAVSVLTEAPSAHPCSRAADHSSSICPKRPGSTSPSMRKDLQLALAL